MIHELKCWPGPFKEILNGRKRHEVRKADRPYMLGDTVILKEYKPLGGGEYTGRQISFLIGHVTKPGEWGLPDGVCVFSLVNELRSKS